MDTIEKYLNDEFYIVMAGELPPDFVIEARGEGVEFGPARRTHLLNGDVKVDGWLTFYDPDLLKEGKPYKHGTIPFRSVDKDGPWFARPDQEKGKKHPIWKWQNPDQDPHENITLKPSVGFGDDFHCWVKGGEIEWV